MKSFPPGVWQMTIAWRTTPKDIDSHVYFGPSASSTGTGGVNAMLDRDDTSGHGFGTTSILNSDN